jgi:hypothetical protein
MIKNVYIRFDESPVAFSDMAHGTNYPHEMDAGDIRMNKSENG